MLISLERIMNDEALIFVIIGATPEQRKDELPRFVRGLKPCQSQRWMHGNTGEPPASTQITVKRDIPFNKSPIAGGSYRHLQMSKEKCDIGVVSLTRETEGDEKSEGSLSVLIVLIEDRGINSRKPGLGKGDTLKRDCSLETSNNPEL